MLYDFNNLKKLLTKIAPVTPNQSEKNFLVEGENFTEKHNRGEVEYTDEGIFVIIHGKKHQRYIYKKKYSVTYSSNISFPKFHFIKCSAVVKWGINNYYSANTENVLVIDKSTGEKYPNKVLSICGSCLREAVTDDVPVDTEEFFKQKDEEAMENKTVPTDIYGYTYDWTEISKNYRVANNLTCKRCSTTVAKGYDELYLHVHHKNGDKTFNHTSNLECLCILCHSDVDEHHNRNFSTQRMKNIICNFLRAYKGQLKSKNKPLYQKHNAICKQV
jgi:hypothetical protein